ncbi:hypothetical protein [Streptomyces sp. NPDC086519]|uniref:hypothetical protein n=1 Tax=Streptomyces sp. NPDC086519 TaxID=3154863 RepID=UPI00343B14FC
MGMNKLLAAGLVTGTALVAALATTPASANPAADCSSGQVCLYYNSSAYGYGAVYKQSADISDYAGYTFKAGNNGSAGAGLSVKNHAAAVDSWYNGLFVIYYNSNYGCSVECFLVGANKTLDLSSQIKNNNASGRFEG